MTASWETFWRMIALIITDQLGKETSSRFDPLVKWICQGGLIQRGNVVRTPFSAVAYQLRHSGSFLLRLQR